MYVVLWRYNARSEWYLHNKPVPSEQAARQEINSMTRYDVSGRREYRFAAIGDADTWHDPFAEQAARIAAIPDTAMRPDETALEYAKRISYPTTGDI